MQEWIRSDTDERAVAEGCYFDLKAAERVRSFCRQFLTSFQRRMGRQPSKKKSRERIDGIVAEIMALEWATE